MLWAEMKEALDKMKAGEWEAPDVVVEKRWEDLDLERFVRGAREAT